MAKIRMRKVFVPGGLPEYTYVPRDELGLEKRLRAASDNLCKLVTVTGPTKSGKSVLTKRLYPLEKSVWIDGGSVTSEEEIWQQIVDRLDGFTRVGQSESSNTTKGGTVETSGSGGVPLVFQAGGKIVGEFKLQAGETQSGERAVPSKAAAIELLTSSGKALIIDDFHYLAREMQASVVRAVKAIVFAGHPVILLAIPHRQYDATRVEKEMTGRVEHISIPVWTNDQLSEIAKLGFPYVNVNVPKAVVDSFINEALGSPHLMQEFCRKLCEENDIEETVDVQLPIEPIEGIDALFKRVATDTSKAIFDRLAKGPRPRTDRNMRKFKSGVEGDIYVCVLCAIATLKPGLSTVRYEDIRSALRELLDEIPEAHEVSRVIEHMSKIQSDEAASTPVLDWDKKERQLHIVDPFFAFFLRWGEVKGQW